jgi:cytochrome c oxidase cbb3-type subunit 3
MRHIVIAAAALLASCGGAERPRFADRGQLVRGNRQTELQPGPETPMRAARNPYAGDPRAILQGERLFHQFNCSGCHSNGGGGMGPPLIDDQWIYGSGPENIFWTIIEGRPNGMPAFGGRIVEEQVWRIVAYVRSLAGLEKRESADLAPAPDSVSHGRQVFLSGPCVMCHTVRGALAMSRFGPDLTNVASRETLAAGALPNTRGGLAGWILNPQNLKPGTQMPPTQLAAEDLHALLDYLETLR